MRFNIQKGLLLLSLLFMLGCNDNPELASKTFPPLLFTETECEVENKTVKHVYYRCPKGSNASGYNPETGQLHICPLEEEVITDCVYDEEGGQICPVIKLTSTCQAKEGFKSCYDTYKMKETIKTCWEKYCNHQHPNICSKITMMSQENLGPAEDCRLLEPCSCNQYDNYGECVNAGIVMEIPNPTISSETYNNYISEEKSGLVD